MSFGFNSGYVEDLYAQYLQNPDSVGDSWREFFADFDPGPKFAGTLGAPPSKAEGKSQNMAAPAGVRHASGAPAPAPVVAPPP